MWKPKLVFTPRFYRFSLINSSATSSSLTSEYLECLPSNTLMSVFDISYSKCFIVSRCVIYNKEYNKCCTVADDYINAINCTGNYEEILTKYSIDYLLISKDSALAKNIFNNSEYDKLFEDKISYVIKVKK